jgi:antitoxin component YwqK of YwqJK toxin-antitoxin module
VCSSDLSVEEWYELGNKKYEKKFIFDQYQITEWYENGFISKKYTLINDKIEGMYNELHVNGKLKTIKYFKNGLLNGTSTEWHINGNKRLETEYLNGKIIEKYKKIYKDNKEIVPIKIIKLRSISTYNRVPFLIPTISPQIIKPLVNNPVRKTSSNLYDKYKDSQNFLNEITNKKNIEKTNPTHYGVRKSSTIISGLLLFDDKKYIEIN